MFKIVVFYTGGSLTTDKKAPYMLVQKFCFSFLISNEIPTEYVATSVLNTLTAACPTCGHADHAPSAGDPHVDTQIMLRVRATHRWTRF